MENTDSLGPDEVLGTISTEVLPPPLRPRAPAEQAHPCHAVAFAYLHEGFLFNFVGEGHSDRGRYVAALC